MGNVQSASDNGSNASLNKTESMLTVRDDFDSNGSQIDKNHAPLEFKLLGKEKKVEEKNMQCEFSSNITGIEMLSSFSCNTKNIQEIECLSNAHDDKETDSVSQYIEKWKSLESIKKELEDERTQNLKLSAEKNVLIQVKANLSEEITNLKLKNVEFQMKAEQAETFSLNEKKTNDALRTECALLKSELAAYRTKEADSERSKNEILNENQKNHHELKKEIVSLRSLLEISSNIKIKNETKSQFTQTDRQTACMSKLTQTEDTASKIKISVPIELELSSSQTQSQYENLTTSPKLNEKKSHPNLENNPKTRASTQQTSYFLSQALDQVFDCTFDCDIKSDIEKAKEIIKKDSKKKPPKTQKIRNILNDATFPIESTCSKDETETNQRKSITSISFSQSSITSTQKENKPRTKRKNSEITSDFIDLTNDDDDMKPTFSKNHNDARNSRVSYFKNEYEN